MVLRTFLSIISCILLSLSVRVNASAQINTGTISVLYSFTSVVREDYGLNRQRLANVMHRLISALILLSAVMCFPKHIYSLTTSNFLDPYVRMCLLPLTFISCWEHIFCLQDIHLQTHVIYCAYNTTSSYRVSGIYFGRFIARVTSWYLGWTAIPSVASPLAVEWNTGRLKQKLVIPFSFNLLSDFQIHLSCLLIRHFLDTIRDHIS